MVGLPAAQGFPGPALLPAGEVPGASAAAPAPAADGRRDRPGARNAGEGAGGAAGLHGGGRVERARGLGAGGVRDVSGFGREGEEAFLQEEEEGDEKVSCGGGGGVDGYIQGEGGAYIRSFRHSRVCTGVCHL